MKRHVLIMVLGVLFLAGCAHVVSDSLRDKARDVPPATLLGNPDAYKGEVVILGGVIVGSKNTKEGTYIEVVQKPLDSRGRPEDVDASYGRFLVLYDGYLDTAIYSRGKEITVAGEVIGRQTRRLDEIDYPYLMMRGREIHLIEPRGYRSLPISFGVGIGARL